MPRHINISCLLAAPQIVGDAVGWGFVVRGSAPCHIQAVDPGGPAAAAGMKVRTGGMDGVLPHVAYIMFSVGQRLDEDVFFFFLVSGTTT